MSKRSDYITNLLIEKKKIESDFKNSSQDVIKNILHETVKDGLREVISEDKNAFEEEEVEDDNDMLSTEPESDVEDTDTEEEDSEIEDELPEDDIEDDDQVDNEESDEDTSDDWKDLEQYKDEDGEFDLRDMNNDDVVKIFKKLGPDDGVRIVKDCEVEDGKITFNDNDTEYVIELGDDINTSDNDYEDDDDIDISDEDDDINISDEDDDDIDISDEDDDDIDDSDEDEDDIDIEIEDDDIEDDNKVRESLGYTDNYQNKTAMTTPNNNEPASSRKTYSMDGGVPTGINKPFAGKGNNSPYTDDLDEEIELELDDEQVNETMTTQEEGPYNRGVGMYHGNNNNKAARGRNSHEEGRQVKGTGENSYSSSVSESIKRKANSIFRENKELKALIPGIKKQLEECIVINQSLANVVKLVCENSTTLGEKKDILKRFNNVNSVKESNKLFNNISEELNKQGKSNKNINEMINSNTAQNVINENNNKPLYQDNDSISFMKRLDKIAK